MNVGIQCEIQSWICGGHGFIFHGIQGHIGNEFRGKDPKKLYRGTGRLGDNVNDLLLTCDNGCTGGKTNREDQQ